MVLHDCLSPVSPMSSDTWTGSGEREGALYVREPSPCCLLGAGWKWRWAALRGGTLSLYKYVPRPHAEDSKAGRARMDREMHCGRRPPDERLALCTEERVEAGAAREVPRLSRPRMAVFAVGDALVLGTREGDDDRGAWMAALA